MLLSGCTGSGAMDRAMELRQQLQNSGCGFVATLGVDYGDCVQEFVLRCDGDRTGELRFEVLAPEEIAGITGSVDGLGGKLTFDDRVLTFEPLAEGRLAPVTAPWVVVNALRSGYLSACTGTKTGLTISLDDTYRADALRVEVRTLGDTPVFAEIFWEGRRVLSLRIENFRLL
jgi:hypothetical protein